MTPAAGARAEATASAAALALLVFLAIPGSQYLGNITEFMVPPGRLASVLLAPALVLVIVVLVGLRLGRAADFSRFRSIVAALTLLVWFQAYLLVWDYGLLDGRPIDWSTPWWRGWVDLPLWIAGLVAAAVFHRRLAGALSTAAFVAVGLQVALLAWGTWQQREVFRDEPSQSAAASRPDAMPRFSRTRNVVHLVLDSFQADLFKDIVDGPAGPYFREALGGFTFFEENLGSFPGTYFALPAIVSGQVYRNDVPRRTFIDGAFGGKSVLNAAHAAGFEVDLASEAMMLDMLMKGRYDNAYLVARPPVVEEAARLLDLALFRAAPHWLKRAVYNEQRWRVRRIVTGSDPMAFHYFRHGSFLADVTKRLVVDRDAPVYKFFHLMTTHEPYVVNPDCSYAGGVTGRGREHAIAQSQCSLALAAELFDRMKGAGIYDDSLIVIMGDHGAHIAPRRYRRGVVVAGDTTYDLRPSFVGLATPLLAIKPPGARSPLRISTDLTRMSDVAATIDHLLGLRAGVPGASLLDAARDTTAARSFYGLDWKHGEAATDYVRALQEYRVSGSAYDSKSWHLGDRLPAPTR